MNRQRRMDEFDRLLCMFPAIAHKLPHQTVYLLSYVRAHAHAFVVA